VIRRPRAVVTGGAGFLGSHLCDRLLAESWDVVCIDSLLTGSVANIGSAGKDPAFTFIQHDVTRFIEIAGPIDWILHFASPASPRDYLEHPIKTLKVGALGTLNCLGLAKAADAGILLASTSEVYGDPQVHPQPESYWGNVNPVGPRSVYDEAKRYAEAISTAYRHAHDLQVKIVRIFNTYGPRMRSDDGRAVPTFISQALNGEPITVHGDGSQIRSLCYVDDVVEGIFRLLTTPDLPGPINIGNLEAVTVLQLAELIRDLVGTTSPILFTPRPADDPEVRCPDITLAMTTLDWQPTISLGDGLARTIASVTGAASHAASRA
jgi:dTDP-glucose 4,6-dehydratase